MCRRWIYLASFVLVLSLAFASGTKAADPNLVGSWPLSEGLGEIAADLSGSGMDGTIYNPDGGLGVDGSVWVEDPERGTVISFNGADGSGAYVVTDVIIPAMTIENDFTWAFWAKQHVDQETNNDVILGNRYGGADTPEFVKFTPTRFENYNNDGSYINGINYESIPADVWIHHVVVKDGAELTYYRDGQVVMTNTMSFVVAANPFYMGADGFSGAQENWEGYLSDVRLYDRALTRLDILAAMAGVEQVDMEIVAAVEPPVIDGEVDFMWESASTQSFVPLDDPANASGTWKVLYDTENLYVLVDVTDDSLQNDSASAWQDDSVEFYFDGGNTKLDTALSGDDHQYTFGWTADDIQGTNIEGATEGIEQAQVTTDTGWRIEIKMPWLSIQGVAPQAGDLIGLDSYYNDDDDGGDSREGKMLSFSAVEGWNDASQWGTAILGATPEPVDPGTDGLVAFYALENNTDDSSGNGLNGTAVGDPVYGAGFDGLGSAMDFDGIDDVVELGPVDVVGGGITLSAWIKPDTFAISDARIISKATEWAGDSHFWMMSTQAETQLRFRLMTDEGSAITTLVSPNAVLETGVWMYVTATWDGATMRVYRDGIEVGSVAKGGAAVAVDPTVSAAIGSQPSDAFDTDPSHVVKFFDGLIDEVAIYNRALSVSEMLYLAGFRADAGDASLSIHYTFDEIGDVVADQSGNGHDGVVVGDVTAEANGMVNGAANFANGGYLDLDGPSIPAEDIPTSAMTLAAWINMANTGGDHEIFSARASDGSWLIHPEPKSSGDIRWLLRSYGGTTMFQIRAGTVTWDQWLHFTGTYDKESGKAALYINGELTTEDLLQGLWMSSACIHGRCHKMKS
jgi:cellulose/xylan binding protein with CBM9 domain/concanavalin A-like lectin/glucanase superfamily protein